MARYRIIERYDSYDSYPTYSPQKKILCFWITTKNFYGIDCVYETKEEAVEAIKTFERRKRHPQIVGFVTTDSNDEASK